MSACFNFFQPTMLTEKDGDYLDMLTQAYYLKGKISHNIPINARSFETFLEFSEKRTKEKLSEMHPFCNNADLIQHVTNLYVELKQNVESRRLSKIDAIQIARLTDEYFDKTKRNYALNFANLEDYSKEQDKAISDYLSNVNPIISSKPWLKSLITGLIYLTGLSLLYIIPATLGCWGRDNPFSASDAPDPIPFTTALLFATLTLVTQSWLVAPIAYFLIGAYKGYSCSRDSISSAEHIADEVKNTLKPRT